MINEKYYNDIKRFPEQFKIGFDSTKNLKVNGNIDKIVVCGMGGSSLYVELVNDYLTTFTDFRVEVNRSYDITSKYNDNTLFIVASYSGNTEEILSILTPIKKHHYKHIIFTAGGKLLEDAKTNNTPCFEIPSGLQPRLSTGYFIAGLLQILHNHNIIEDKSDDVQDAVAKIIPSLDENYAKSVAKRLINKVIIIYATQENASISRITKIKFNESAKTQAYWNYFTELNHNEMVGYKDLVAEYFFLIFQSKFTHNRNYKRIDIFAKMMIEKKQGVEIIEMKGNNVLEEILNSYYLSDYIAFHLAQFKNIDPEPVFMVENFKKKLNE